MRVRRRWSRKGVVAKALEALALERDGESFLIDAAIMRAHQDASGAQRKEGPQQIGRSRGGPSTKLHAVVDALGLRPTEMERRPSGLRPARRP